MNETMKVLTTRRSIRKFKVDEVPQELLDQIVEAGMYAPTGKGAQSPIIIAVTNKQLRDEIAAENAKIGGWQEGFDPFYGAPVIFLVAADANVGTAVYDGGLRAVVLQTGDLTVAKVCGNKTQVEQFAYLRDDIDVYVTDYAYQTYAAQNKTVLSMYQSKLAFNLGASRYGNFTIRPKDDTIVVGFR